MKTTAMLGNDNPTNGSSKRERTRSRLLAAALEVVEERGFVAASLDEIAARAAMSKGAIYSNFDSKASLMLALMRSRTPAFAPDYAPDATLREQLRTVARTIDLLLPAMRSAARLGLHFEIYLQSEPALRAEVERDVCDGLGKLVDFLKMHDDGSLLVPAETLIMTIQTLAIGLVHQSITTPELIDDARILAMFELVADGAVRKGN